MFFALIVATVWSLSAFLFGPTQVSTADTRPYSSEPSQPTDSDKTEDEVEVDTDSAAALRGDGSFTFEIDASGMAVMPVTTDPAEAAAGAAAVMWNVPASKMTRQEFFDEAIQRISYPSPDYVGPEGEIHTMILGGHFGLTENRIYLAPDVAMAAKVKASGEKDHAKPRGGFPWSIADGSRYDGLRAVGVDQVGVPVLVMSAEEMEEWSTNSVPVSPIPADIDWTPDTPGATITTWYVLTEISDGLVGADGMGQKVGISFGIWCDAPEQGGICGVASTLDLELPLNWPETSQ